ncbi:MAG: hypothetical protein JST63_07720 [Bacteroidetes bacterium]|nr:hypothetical protein [Bacteroidota bacterium]
MKNCIFLTIVILFLAFDSNSQITKNNWLLSGSVSFSTQKNSSTASLQYKHTDIQISPSIGYFLIDKFAAGIRPSYMYGKNNLVANGKPQTIFSIGPFLRYYFLQKDNPFNLFAEGSYAYASFNQASESKQHTFSISAGPVLYFNTSVGLEFTFGYSTTKVVGFTGSNNAIRFGIGFQFYLEREE